MPILDRMTRNNQPDDDNNGNHSDSEPHFDYPRPEPIMRSRPKPHFLEAQHGRRKISFSAAIERICEQFRGEYPPNTPPMLEAQTRLARLQLLLPVVEYMVGVESLTLTDDERAALVESVYSEVFGLSVLDPLINDPAITTITLDGDQKISVRYGHGELEPLDILFEDNAHFKEVIGRLLQRAGVRLLEEMPLIEAGFLAESGRFVSMTVAAPPTTLTLSMDIRVHPAAPPTLEQLISRKTLDEKTAQFLQALMQSDYGVMLIGQPESGKTMTLSALLAELPDAQAGIAVERTGELHLPQGMASVVPRWSAGRDDDGITFGEQIEAQLANSPQLIVLDEVRSDEPHTIAALLRVENPPRLIWSLRGATNTKRLYAALSMLAQRADTFNGEQLVHNLFERMPFVLFVRRFDGKIQLSELGEWVGDAEGMVRYRSLMAYVEGEWRWSGVAPARALGGLNEVFWT